MIEDFLQKKIAGLLQQFIEFQKFKLGNKEGMSIKNSTIKPKLVEELSQILSMPLEHTYGSISSLSLNLPWQRLFMLKQSQVQITMQGVKLKAKLRNGLSESYLMKKRENQVESLTEKLFNPFDSINKNSSFINKKLQEYFLSTIVLQIKNLALEIQIDLKHKVQLILKVDSCVFRKQNRQSTAKNTINLTLQGLGLYYRNGGSKEVELISPANLTFERVKREGGQGNKRVSTYNFNIDRILVHMNNYNYGDIARVILVIQWHNSFMNVPCSVWPVKPFVLSECKPIIKFIYCANLIRQSIHDNNFKKQLKYRTEYIQLYSKLLNSIDSFSEGDKTKLSEMEKNMPLWKIAAYRSFLINKKIKQVKTKSEEVDKSSSNPQAKDNFNMMNMMNSMWFKRWFSSQKDATELQQQFLSKVASIESVPNQVQSVLSIKVQTIVVKIQIITAFGNQPFVSLIGYHCEFIKQSLLIEKTWQKTIQFRKCKIEFEKYLGHHERYKNMLCESKQHFTESEVHEKSQQQEDDEFEDINYFLQMNYRNDSKVIKISLLPFDLYLNHEIIEKIMILLNVETLSKISKVEKIEEAYLLQYDPWLIVEHQREKTIQLKKSLQTIDNLPSPLKRQVQEEYQLGDDQPAEDIEQEKQICLKSAANVIIMSDLRVYPTTELVIQLGSFEVRLWPTSKKILLKRVSLIGKFLPKASEEEEPLYLSLVEPQMKIFTVIQPFNVNVELKSHVSFDQTFFEVSPIKINTPEVDSLFNIIELVFQHMPKQKENRIKQYYRRKQSIGEQFMDACQNLNEHITKSMVMSSEKMTNRTIIKEKRTKLTNIKLSGFALYSQFLTVDLQEVELLIKQIGYDNKVVESYNEKEITIVISNIKQTLKNIQSISNHVKKESIKKGLIGKMQKKEQKKFNNIEIAHINLIIKIQLKSKEGQPQCLYMEATKIKFEENEEANSQRIQGIFKVSYDEELMQSKKEIVKTPFIEGFSIQSLETYKFNFHQRWIGINSLAINIKPSFFKFMALLVKEYHIDDKDKFILTNGVANVLQIKVPPKNFYIEQRHNQKSIFLTPFCQIALFNKKFQLVFNRHECQDIPKRKIQCIELSHNNFLINREVSPNEYLIQSNVRIINHQDRTFWIKLGQSETQITPKQLQNRSKFSMLTFQHRPERIDLTQQISLKQKEWDGFSPRKNRFQKKERAGRSMSLPLKQKQMLHLLIDSDEYRFIQIVDQGNRYTELEISELFESTQIVVSNEDSEENQFLVIRSEISSVEGIEGSIYTFHIYSPVYIVNKTPWILEYRLSQEEGSSIVMENEEKKPSRRRSFEVLPMKKVSTLASEKIRSFHLSEIQSMKLSLKKYERDFPGFSNLIQKIREKNPTEEKGFIKDSELITLRNGRSEIQVILCLQFSDNIMKIKLHPQFVFINLTSLPLQFRVKEEQVTYHQIKLPSLRVDEKEKKHKESNYNPNAYINELANLNIEKFKTKEVLKQLFQTYDAGLQTFTGTLKKEISKKMVYYSGKEVIKREMSFLKSSAGYLSDFVGSDNEFVQEKNLKKETLIMEEEIIHFGPDEHMIFKRSVEIQKYFNLVIFLPTVHIINKTQATFYAKSPSELLIKIGKESHNYIVTNHGSVDIQACLEDEDISLSEWTRVDLEELKTIYYSKDMIQHHGSGYESKEYTFRKKRMKKVPKIFYKVIICKYEWGQKILIEESQYPPISFINNTRHRIKIEEGSERFSEQLINQGDMGQYAPKDPYHTPLFQLSVAEHYSYRLLKEFGVTEKHSFVLDYGIVLSIEEYKDKVIINIKESSEAKLTVSMVERSMLKDYKEGDLMLQEVKKQTLQIKELTIAILNSWNRELNATIVQELILSHENKNYKDYYKLEINMIEGYDYMGIQPEFIFHQKKKEKNRFSQQLKSKPPKFIEIAMVVNYHKNALIFEQCEGRITDSVFIISADLILAYVKNFYDPISLFMEVLNYYSTQNKSSSQLSKKRFIVQSLRWSSTSLTIKARNLSIIQTFLNKNYERLIIKFLIWIGDIKPLVFDEFSLNHEQTTLKILLTQINLKRKMQVFGALLMDYPLSELKEILMLLAGDQSKSIGQKLYVLYKILKSIEYIVSWALSHNENMKMQIKSYNEQFIQENKDNSNLIDKMKKYQYCEWKYHAIFPPNKLKGHFRRLERYNTRTEVLKYDVMKGRVKLALDSFISNKVHRSIDKVYVINEGHMVSITSQWIVIYFCNNNEWLVLKPQHFLNCRIEKGILIFSFWEYENQVEEHQLGYEGRIRELRFRNLEEGYFLSGEALEQFNSSLRQNILMCYY